MSFWKYCISITDCGEGLYWKEARHCYVWKQLKSKLQSANGFFKPVLIIPIMMSTWTLKQVLLTVVGPPIDTGHDPFLRPFKWRWWRRNSTVFVLCKRVFKYILNCLKFRDLVKKIWWLDAKYHLWKYMDPRPFQSVLKNMCFLSFLSSIQYDLCISKSETLLCCTFARKK